MNPDTLNLPPLSSPEQFARLTGLSESTIRRYIHTTKPTEHGWPPLTARRLPDGRLRITASDGAAWIAALPEA